jgi:exopolysaccharide biosynthesis polyprenyl glycosylphosphotransferase
MEGANFGFKPITTKISANTVSNERVQEAARAIPVQNQWRLYTIALLISDLLMVGLAFRLAYWVRFELNISIFQIEVEPDLSFYQLLVFFLTPLWLAIFAFLGLYNRQNLLGGTQEYSLVFTASAIGMLILMSAGFIEPSFIFARGWLLLAWGFSFFLVDLGRFVLRRIVYYLRRHGYFLSVAVIVGANNEGISLAEQLLSWSTSGLHVIGFVDKKIPVGKNVYQDIKVIGTVDELDTLVEQYKVEELILASSAITSRDKLVDIFMRYGVKSEVNVRMSSGLYEIITTGLNIKEFAYVPLVGINPARLAGVDQALKLLFDYCITIPGMLVLSPILFLIALIIRIDSPGPVIHCRKVMGMNGRQFNAFKFRTMHVNGEEILEQHPDLKRELEQNHKLKDDPRITRVGRILRKTSLDELPQLFNVLKREMSLVGPRMITLEETTKYDKYGTNLLTVRPGITGLWQVSGRSDVSYPERVRLDMYYVRNWSIWLDIQIMIATPSAVLSRRGAY